MGVEPQSSPTDPDCRPRPGWAAGGSHDDHDDHAVSTATPGRPTTLGAGGKFISLLEGSYAPAYFTSGLEYLVARVPQTISTGADWDAAMLLARKSTRSIRPACGSLTARNRGTLSRKSCLTPNSMPLLTPAVDSEDGQFIRHQGMCAGLDWWSSVRGMQALFGAPYR